MSAQGSFQEIFEKVAAEHRVSASGGYISKFADGRELLRFETKGAPVLAFFADLARELGIPLDMIRFDDADIDRNYDVSHIEATHWVIEMNAVRIRFEGNRWYDAKPE